jgi:hypothetical protein
MTHLLREELVRWRDQGLSEDRDRVLGHLAACKRCAEVYAELVRTTPVDRAPEHFNPADFVKRGYAARQGAAAKPRADAFLSWKMWAGALSAAALVVLVVAAGPDLRRLFEAPDTARGTGIEWVTPATPHSPVSTLEWKTGLLAARFHIEIADSTGAMVYQADTSDSSITLPASVTAALQPGRSFTLRVTALDRDGQAMATTAETFSPSDATR